MPDRWTEAIRQANEALHGEAVLRWEDREVRLTASQGKRTKEWFDYGDRLIAQWGRHAATATRTFEPGQLAELRADQRVSLFEWGGDAGEDPHVLRTQIERFGEAMRSASKAFARKSYDPNRLPGFFPEPLEHLVRDILNEDSLRARGAGLAEDFLEKTDLRVRYPDLDRPRGARIQVSWATHAKAQEAKLNSVVLRDEYVFVTPITMSAWCGVTVTDWSRQVTFALRHPLDSPLGPMHHVPLPWREAIRQGVYEQALSSTEKMRSRQNQRDLR